MSELTAEFVRAALLYDPLTGIFRRKTGNLAGRITGRICKGYQSVFVGNKHRLSHRVAWLYAYGELPPSSICVDHINGIPTDNRIANLRLATRSQNAQNRRSSKTGKKGTCFNRVVGKWQAQICLPGKQIYLGIFDTEDEAHARYLSAAKELFGEFANGQSREAA